MVLSWPAGFNATGVVGEKLTSFLLNCSAHIVIPSSDYVPPPSFEWFFGLDNSSESLPLNMTVSNVTNNSNTYTSTLQFPALSESAHTGLYTCRLGGNERLAASTNVTVKGSYHAKQWVIYRFNLVFFSLSHFCQYHWKWHSFAQSWLQSHMQCYWNWIPCLGWQHKLSVD